MTKWRVKGHLLLVTLSDADKMGGISKEFGKNGCSMEQFRRGRGYLFLIVIWLKPR